MIIAIASTENHLKAMVDPHFGRCNWFFLHNTETLENQFIENTVRNHQEKAGCDVAKLLIDKNINIAIAGRFGAKVVDMFRQNNIQMVIPETEKTVKEIINQIK